MPDETTTTPAVETAESTTQAAEPATVEEVTIKNPEGLLSTLEKYKKLGSVNDLARQLKEFEQQQSILDGLQQGGIKLTDVPTIIAAQKQQEQAEAQRLRDIELATTALKTEAEAKEKTLLTQIKQLKEGNLAERRKNHIQQYFNAHVKEGFAADFSSWYAMNSQHIVFKPDSSEISHFNDLTGQKLMIETVNEIRDAEADDFFLAVADGKYGSLAQSAIRSRSEARGAGNINASPGVTQSGRFIFTTAQLDGANVHLLSDKERRAIATGNYTVRDV